jgi:hypothetical protein
MPRPCHSSAMPCRVNSHIPCRAPAILRQCRVLRESPRGSRKYPNCLSYRFTGWYAFDNNLHGTPRSSRKKPKADRSSTCRLWADYSMPILRCDVVLRSCMVVAWHGRGIAFGNQTRLCSVNQTGKTQSEPLGTRHGRDMGTA